MPQRKITIPATIQFCEPGTSRPIQNDTLTFEQFVAKLYGNMLWSKSYKGGLAQQSILRAIAEARSKESPTFLIADEDWEMLVEAARNPSVFLLGPGGGVVVPGIGINAAFAMQYLPHQQAIIDAELV